MTVIHLGVAFSLVTSLDHTIHLNISVRTVYEVLHFNVRFNLVLDLLTTDPSSVVANRRRTLSTFQIRWMDHNDSSLLEERDQNSLTVDNSLNKRNSYLSSPPYWQRKRSTTQSTITSVERPPPITLTDNTELDSKSHNHLWARSITIDDHVVIEGNSAGIGSYVVWICKVETIDGSPLVIRKRYSEFDDLRNKLLKAFPDSTKTSLPPLPPKSAIYKFKPKFLEKRRQGLSYFLNCVMLSPRYASSIIVKDFIFQHDTGAWYVSGFEERSVLKGALLRLLSIMTPILERFVTSAIGVLFRCFLLCQMASADVSELLPK